MRKALLPLAFAGVIAACSSDPGGVDPDAIPVAQKHALWMALDSAFRHDTTLDRAFTGDSGLYALMSTLVIPFVDRASRIAVGGGSDTARAVGIEFDIDATRGAIHVVSNLTAIIAWKGYDSTRRTIDSVVFLLGSGRAPVNDSLWSRFTLDTAGTGTGFVIHQKTDSTVTKWLSRRGHLRTTTSQYGSSQGGSTFNVARGMLNGEFTITATSVPDASTTVTSALDFGSGARAVKVQIRGTLP
jgi:hypothetical protein